MRITPGHVMRDLKEPEFSQEAFRNFVSVAARVLDAPHEADKWRSDLERVMQSTLGLPLGDSRRLAEAVRHINQNESWGGCVVTRWEALKAIDEGQRVEGLLYGNWYLFGIDKNDGEMVSNHVESMDNHDAFLSCAEYRLVPEPDTAEKILRDLKTVIELHGCNNVSDDALYSLHCRATDVLSKLDGGK